MGLFTDSIIRGKTCVRREEDTMEVYCGTKSELVAGEYNQYYSYIISSGVNCPEIEIHAESIPFMSFHGKDKVILTDVRGNVREAYKVHNTIFIPYNQNGDYTEETKKGYRYTIDELKKDAIKYIQQIEKMEYNKVKEISDLSMMTTEYGNVPRCHTEG